MVTCLKTWKDLWAAYPGFMCEMEAFRAFYIWLVWRQALAV